jgi:mono/diheme cytochrome c family protein
MNNNGTARRVAAAVGAAFAFAVTLAHAADAAKSGAKPSDIARGRYLALIGGCNDCHTAGFAASGGKVPEAQWLLGDGALGFRGPWGTTYAPNLRVLIGSMSENQWVNTAKTLKTRPPMPWFTLNEWTSADLRAIYRYIKQLGPPGDAVTAFIPPDKTPKPPFIQWPAPPK